MTGRLKEEPAVRAVTGGRGRGPCGQLATLSPGAQPCAVPQCGEAVDPSRLMCRRHWYVVPKAIRDQVWASWRSGQGAFSPEHRAAVVLSVAAVLAVEAAARPAFR
jgi:hypothetical protein